MPSGTRRRAEIGVGATILVIHESQEELSALADALSSLGVRVLTRTTTIGALAFAARERPDIVLVALAMPLMAGDELVQALRAHAATADTILLLSSPDASEGLAQAAVGCRANGWITTSATDELVREVATWLLRKFRARRKSSR